MSPVDLYTHEFKFDIEGNFITGEVEFDTDDKVSFKMLTWSQPLSLDIMGKFNELMTLMGKIYNENGAIKKIIIKKKE